MMSKTSIPAGYRPGASSMRSCAEGAGESGRVVEAQARAIQGHLDPLPFDVELRARSEHAEEVWDVEHLAGLGEHVVVGATSGLEPGEGDTRGHVAEAAAEPLRVTGDELDGTPQRRRRSGWPDVEPAGQRGEPRPETAQPPRAHGEQHAGEGAQC